MQTFKRAVLIASLSGLPLLLPVLKGGETVSELIRVEGRVPIPMRDGVKLYADIYRPRREGKFPVLVTRTPYGVQRDGMHEPRIRFAQSGYVSIIQDTRGRFESDGKWEPFRNEAEDGYDTIQWAAQQPWSNGKVAMQGGSYLGHVQWRAASQAPPNLVTIFPAVASTSIYNNWAYFGGAFRLSFNYGWGVVRMPQRIMLPQHWHDSAFTPEEWRYQNILWHVPLGTGDLVSANQVVQHYRDWVKHQSYDNYWKAISDEEKFSSIKVPVHTHGGWFDIFLAGTLNGFTGMRTGGGSDLARRETKMTVGPWGHGPSQKFGEVDFGPTAMRSLSDREFQWYNHYLKGEANGIDQEAPVQIFYMGINQWHREQDWPIPGTRFTEFHISSDGKANTVRGDGRLGRDKPNGVASDHYLYDPDQPVPTVGGNNCCGTPTLAGPRDQRSVESRNDVLVYSSSILKEPLAIAGPVKMKLYAATDGPDTDFVVKLVDVHPNGFAMNIAEGILRARFRKGLDQMELLKPGQTYEFVIDMAGTANVFLPGHRIRVDVTSSHFPQFDRNPNTGEDLGVSDKVRIARQTVFHSPDKPSHILLPVVEIPAKETIGETLTGGR